MKTLYKFFFLMFIFTVPPDLKSFCDCKGKYKKTGPLKRDDMRSVLRVETQAGKIIDALAYVESIKAKSKNKSKSSLNITESNSQERLFKF